MAGFIGIIRVLSFTEMKIVTGFKSIKYANFNSENLETVLSQ